MESELLAEARDLGGHNISGLFEQALIEYLQNQTEAEILNCSICGYSHNVIHTQNKKGTLCVDCFKIYDQTHEGYAKILGLNKK